MKKITLFIALILNYLVANADTININLGNPYDGYWDIKFDDQIIPVTPFAPSEEINHSHVLSQGRITRYGPPVITGIGNDIAPKGVPIGYFEVSESINLDGQFYINIREEYSLDSDNYNIVEARGGLEAGADWDIYTLLSNLEGDGKRHRLNGHYFSYYPYVDGRISRFGHNKITTGGVSGSSVPAPNVESTMDADGNANADALTDGLLFIRYMFGIRGESLMVGAVANDCAHCSAAQLEPILAQYTTDGTSDIDGNEDVDALTDGLLIIRYLTGIRGDSLIASSVADDCSRCTALEIETYLQGLMP